MALDLPKLGLLTNESLDAAIAAALKETSEDFIKSFSQLKISTSENPYQRLLMLINPIIIWHNQNKTLEDHLFELSVLALLLGDEIKGRVSLANDTPLLKAIVIFVTFKVHGNEYVSKNGNKDSCLHDTLAVDHYRSPLTQLLVQHGADPDQENNDHLTAFALWLQNQFEEDNIPEISELNSKDLTPKEKLRSAMAALANKKSINYLAYLETLERRCVLKKHPDFLNFTFGEWEDTLLHVAAYEHSAAVVEFLLQNGADPDMTDNLGNKPINEATYRDDKVLPDVIALLLVASIKKSLDIHTLTVSHLVEKLFELSLNDQKRKNACESIFKYPQSFPFTEKDLLTHLESETEKMKCSDITLVEKIGSGSQGSIYSALRKKEKVAVKLSLEDTAKSTLEEMALLKRFNHPNVVKVLGAIYRNNRMGFFMPLAYRSLKKFIEIKPRTIIEKCFYPYGRQINEGMNYIHSQGYAHLDLHCGNILLDKSYGQDDREATVIIADFGVSAKLGTTLNYIATTSYVRSPEQSDTKKPYTTAMDIFSFGKTMGSMGSERINWENKPLELTIENPEMKKNVQQLVMWCCETNPKVRPTTVQIEEYLDQHFKPGR